MRKTVAVIAMVSLVALAGCTGLLGADGEDGNSDVGGNQTVDVEDPAPGATSVNHTLRVEVTEAMAGSEWTAIGATFPRGEFTVDGAKHGDVGLAIDKGADGEVDREFAGSHVSGVNNNEYSFDVTLDTGYTLQQGDVVIVRYPAIDNPSDAGDYDVNVRVNDEQAATGTVTIG